MRPALFSVVCLAAAAAAACQPPDTSAAAKQAIDRMNDQWARLTAQGHADSIADFYDSSAVIMPPNMATMRGRAAIKGFFAMMNTMSTPQPTLALRAESVVASGAVAVERGRWTFTWPASVTRPAGVPPVDSGKYLVRWTERNGRWLMVDDIWNSDLPLPQPPQPTRSR